MDKDDTHSTLPMQHMMSISMTHPHLEPQSYESEYSTTFANTPMQAPGELIGLETSPTSATEVKPYRPPPVVRQDRRIDSIEIFVQMPNSTTMNELPSLPPPGHVLAQQRDGMPSLEQPPSLPPLSVPFQHDSAGEASAPSQGTTVKLSVLTWPNKPQEEPLLVVLELSKKLIFPAETESSAEHAKRAVVRQAMLALKIEPMEATQTELSQLKNLGVVGKHAPSAGLISISDSLKLLRRYSRDNAVAALAQLLGVDASQIPDVARVNPNPKRSRPPKGYKKRKKASENNCINERNDENKPVDKLKNSKSTNQRLNSHIDLVPSLNYSFIQQPLAAELQRQGAHAYRLSDEVSQHSLHTASSIMPTGLGSSDEPAVDS